MADESANANAAALEEVRGILTEFEERLRDLKKRQRKAVEKAVKSVDRTKIARIKKMLSELQ